MAETSGFFQAMVDESTNDYDRKYFAKQFADYFSLFIGNGVFANPTNQLMVVPGTGLSVVVKPGYAFINGYWYWNSTDKIIPLVPNYGTGNRTDTVRVRMSDVTRNMTVDVYTGDTELVRGEDVYDLQLASITVQPMAETLLASAVQDTRPNEQVCGFVTGLLRVETTADLFAQFQSAFDQWFDGIKAELEGVEVGQLLTRMDELEASVDTDLAEMNGKIDEISASVESASSTERIVIGTNSGSTWTGSGNQFAFGTLPSDFSMPTERGKHVFLEILFGIDGVYSLTAHGKTTGPLKLVDNTQKFRIEGFVAGRGYFAREVAWSGALVGGTTLNVGPLKQYKGETWVESDASSISNVLVPRYAFLSVKNKIVNSSGSPWS